MSEVTFEEMVKGVIDYYGIAYPDPACIESDAVSLLRVVTKRVGMYGAIYLSHISGNITVELLGDNRPFRAASLGEAAIRCAFANIPVTEREQGYKPHG